MGLSSTTNRQVYLGDGSSVVFAFPFYFFQPADLDVYLYDTVTALTLKQTLNTNFTVAGNVTAQGTYPGGGSVVMASAVPLTSQIVIVRNPAQTNNYTLQQNGPISATAITQQFDYLTALVQRLQDEVSRSIHLFNGVGVQNSTFSMDLPFNIGLSASANAALIVNSGATGFTLGFASINSSGIPSGFFGTLPIGNGGTSASDQATAISNLVGTFVSGTYLRGNGVSAIMSAIQAGDVPVLNQNTTGTAGNVTGVVGFANGGTTGSTRQSALNALAGGVTGSSFLKGNGTNVIFGPILASDIPVLNQNTTGTAANIVGSGIVAVANGGTGAATPGSALVNLLPTQVGQSGLFLTTNGSSTSWASPTGAFTGARYNLALSATITHMSGSSFAGDNIVWDQRDYDTSSFYKLPGEGVGAGSGLITLPANGYYRIEAQTTFDAGTNTSNNWHYLRRSDAVVNYYFGGGSPASTTGGTHYVAAGSITFAGSSGHKFYVENQGPSGSNNINGADATGFPSTWMTITKVG